MRCTQEARAAFSSLAAALHPTEANKRPRVDGAGSASASSRAPLLEPAAVSSKRRNLVRPYPSYPFSSPEIVMFRRLSVLGHLAHCSCRVGACRVNGRLVVLSRCPNAVSEGLSGLLPITKRPKEPQPPWSEG
jgi:hypothetical protein